MMFFSVYQLHFRLPEPGLHAQPLVQTPPMFHLEGLHTVQWLFSKMDTMSQTVRGDCMRFALKDHDSSKLIPHLPLPLMAGPFLLDTLKNSQYVVLFHHPNVKLDKKEVGIFMWGIASPWRCIEIPMPMPKFMKKLGTAGVARKQAKAAQKAKEAIEKAEQAIFELEAMQEFFDDMTSDEYAEADKKIEAEKKKISETKENQSKEDAKLADAKRYAEDIDAEVGKAPKDESKQAREQRQWELEHEARAEEQSEKAVLNEKLAADTEARRAKRAAEEHDAKAQENYRKAAGASGGGSADSADVAAEHEAKANKQRSIQEQAEAKAKAHDEKAKEHRKKARESRKGISKKSGRREAAKEYAEKQPGGGNPYAAATGAGNIGTLAPSLLAHIPFPCTVFIYRDFFAQLADLGRAALASAATILEGYVGFIFDSLGAGRGAVGQYLASLGKAVGESLIDSGKDYIAEGKVGFKLSTKAGPVTVSAEISRDEAGNYSWKASGKVEKGKFEAEVSHEEKVTSSSKDGKSTREESSSTSAKAKYDKGEASYSESEGIKTTNEQGGKQTVEITDSTSKSGKLGPAEYSESDEHQYTSTTEDGETSIEVTDTNTQAGKVSHGPAEASHERKTVNTQGEDSHSTEVSNTTSGKMGPMEDSQSSSHKVETSDDGSVTTVTDSASGTSRAGPVDASHSTETKTTTTGQGTNLTTEKTTTTSGARTGSPSQFESSTQESTVSNPPPPPVDYSHGAPSIP
jgi:hypothetical protein